MSEQDNKNTVFGDSSPDCGSCMSATAIIDNDDCTLQFRELYASQQLAEQALTELTNKARAVESDPCIIKSEIISQANGSFLLDVSLTFCCQAEVMLFSLK